MQFLSNMRISHKISTLMIGLIVGFIVIGITYYVQINLDKGIREQERVALNFESQLAEANLQQVELFAAANQFIATGQQRYAESYRTMSLVLEEKLAELAVNAGFSAEVQQEISAIAATGKQFDQTLTETTALSETLAGGVGGLRGNSLAAASEVERRLQQARLSELLADFYALRALEVQLLGAVGPLDLAAFNNQLNLFIEKITQSDITAANAREILSQVEHYRDAVAQVGAQQQLLNGQITQLETIQTQNRATFAKAALASHAAVVAIQKQGAERKQVLDAIVTAIIFLVAIGTAVGIYMIYKSIVFPMVHMQSVIGKINRGKTNTRVKVLAKDELGDLGAAFNNLLDERIQQLEEQSKENERLNNSIIGLIRALGMIANKDLTVKVPVSADITGTISDAVNLFTKETAKTLLQVRDISDEVNLVSGQLEEQSSLVMKFAETERRQVIATTKALEVLANAMNDVARRSAAAKVAAGDAIASTQAARGTVLETVSGIRTIRETIAETEKRVKRLGDRSQEISGIVNLINTIAERTHILALNASMHAASAGEAGKGFAVVADEVQRLAENARHSTDEIAAMVNSMRVDTSDTVNIMNTLISQVVDGTRLAEQAGKRMLDTEQATQELVSNVNVIAEHAVQQAEVANRIKERSVIIRSFTEKTARQLEEQRKQTHTLQACAATLVERVNVFTLPEAERSADKTWSNVRKLPSTAEAS